MTAWHHHLWARLGALCLFAVVCLGAAFLFTSAENARDERAALTGQVTLLEQRTATQARRIDELTDLLMAQQDRSDCLDVLEGQLELALVLRFDAVLGGDPAAVEATGALVDQASSRYVQALDGALCPPDP